MIFLGQSESQPIRHHYRFSGFAEMTAKCPYNLQWAAFSSLKIAHSHRDMDVVPWAHRVLNRNDISIGSAVFAGLTSVTGRHTDRPTDRHWPRYSVGNTLRPHLYTYRVLRCGL